MDAPREDLVRMNRSIRSEDDGNTLVGYAAVFNDWTIIDSWEGTFLERLDPKAFNKTLADRADDVKVLFNHGMDPQIGDKPLGKPRSMKPDSKGLAVEVPLDDTSYNQDLKALLRSGALDGMSFRMSVLGEQWNMPDDPSDYNPNSLPERTITQIKLFEFGPVTFPAYAATTAGVRAHAPAAFRAWEQAHGREPIIPQTRAAADPAADDDADDDPGQLAQALDAILDSALAQLEGVDVTSLPPNVQQALALITAADTASDTLLAAMNLPDPDDDPGFESKSVPKGAPDQSTRTSTTAPAAPEPPIEGHSPARSRLTAERRALTLAGIKEAVEAEQTQTERYRRRVENYELETSPS